MALVVGAAPAAAQGDPVAGDTAIPSKAVQVFRGLLQDRGRENGMD